MIFLIPDVNFHFKSRLRYKSLLREGGWVIIGQIFSVVGTLILVRVLTSYLEPNEYGRLALGLTISGVATNVIMAGFNPGVIRFYNVAENKNQLSSYFHASRNLMYKGMCALVIFSLFILIILYLIGLEKWLFLTAIIAPFSIFYGLSTLFNGIQNAARQRATVAFHNGLDSWLKIALAISFIRMIDNTATSVVMGYACSALLILSSQVYFIKRLIPIEPVDKKNSIQWANDMVRYSKPFLIWGVFGWFQQSSARWALEWYSTTDDVGYFSLLSQIGYSPILILTTILFTYVSPIVFSKFGDGSSANEKSNIKSIVNRLTVMTLLITMLASIISGVCHKFIFSILTSVKYFQISVYLPLFIFAGGIFAAAQIYASKLMAYLEPNKLMIASIVSSIIGILSSFIAVYYFHFTGAIVSLVLHSISYFALVLLTTNLSKHNR
jgi:O-antigen/teichoic acid export membrane protein